MEAAHTSWRSLGELFVERGLISEADLERALAEQVATKRRLADILVRRGLVTGHDITSALMEQSERLNDSTGPAPASLRPVEVDYALDDEAPVEPRPVLEPVEDPPDGLTLDECDTGDQGLEHDRQYEPEPAAETDSSVEVGGDPALLPSQDAPVNSARPFVGGDALVENVEASERLEALIREADAQRRTTESRLTAIGDLGQGLSRIQTELEAQKLSTPPLVRELEATQERVRAREQALSAEIASLKRTHEEIERRSGQLGQLRTDLAGKLHDLSELSTTASMWNGRVADLEAEVESLTSHIESVARELAELAAKDIDTPVIAAVTDDPDGTDQPYNDLTAASSQSSSHLLFVPEDDGYELVEREGPPPAVGEAIQLGEAALVVTKVGPSPLPFDDRSCVFISAL